MTENEISVIVVDAGLEVHRELGGPGLLEDVYEEALAEELWLRGIKVERQQPGNLYRTGPRQAVALEYAGGGERACCQQGGVDLESDF